LMRKTASCHSRGHGGKNPACRKRESHPCPSVTDLRSSNGSGLHLQRPYRPKALKASTARKGARPGSSHESMRCCAYERPPLTSPFRTCSTGNRCVEEGGHRGHEHEDHGVENPRGGFSPETWPGGDEHQGREAIAGWRSKRDPQYAQPGETRHETTKVPTWAFLKRGLTSPRSWKWHFHEAHHRAA